MEKTFTVKLTTDQLGLLWQCVHNEMERHRESLSELEAFPEKSRDEAWERAYESRSDLLREKTALLGIINRARCR